MEKTDANFKKEGLNDEHEVKVSQRKNKGFSSLKSIISKFTFEDILLFGILYFLIEEGIEDEFLILIIVLLILT